jgi:uncharacterized protein YbaR (Trm112 family)
MSKETKYEEHQYEERQSMLMCPKCRDVRMNERWLRYLKRLNKYGMTPRKTPKPEAVWCPKCKHVLGSIKQPKQDQSIK